MDNFDKENMATSKQNNLFLEKIYLILGLFGILIIIAEIFLIAFKIFNQDMIVSVVILSIGLVLTIFGFLLFFFSKTYQFRKLKKNINNYENAIDNLEKNANLSIQAERIKELELQVEELKSILNEIKSNSENEPKI